MTILFNTNSCQRVQSQSLRICSLHTFYRGDDFLSEAVQRLSIVLGIKHEPGSQWDGKDYCNREVKKRSTVRQQCGYVRERSSHWALTMWDIALNLAQAYKYSRVCSLCRCCDYVICITSMAPLFANVAYRKELSSPPVVLKLRFGSTVIHNQNLFVFNNEHIHNNWSHDPRSH